MIGSIKRYFAESALKSKMKTLDREKKNGRFSFLELRSVGILFDAGNAEDFELVKRYVVYLREHQKKVKVLGFFAQKQIPALTYSKLEYDFFSVKDLDWKGIPQGATITNFSEESFDILFDLNIHDHFALKYIAGTSKARFKVGKYKEEDIDIYDMMIDADNTKTLKYFLRQVDTYVGMLNPVEEASK